MSVNKRFVQGSVKILRCKECSASFPSFDYEVDSDTDIVGLYSAGTCDGKDLILIDLCLEEWEAAKNGRLSELPSRFLPIIDRHYQMTHILHVNQPITPPAGSSFADFRRGYKAPIVVYWCPCCKGEAIVEEEILPKNYIDAGGRITTVSPLVLIK